MAGAPGARWAPGAATAGGGERTGEEGKGPGPARRPPRPSGAGPGSAAAAVRSLPPSGPAVTCPSPRTEIGGFNRRCGPPPNSAQAPPPPSPGGQGRARGGPVFPWRSPPGPAGLLRYRGAASPRPARRHRLLSLSLVPWAYPRRRDAASRVSLPFSLLPVAVRRWVSGHSGPEMRLRPDWRRPTKGSFVPPSPAASGRRWSEAATSVAACGRAQL